MQLVIGSKDVSSWSLRPWLLMKQAELPFEEILIPFNRPETRARILQHSPSGRVPVLIDEGLAIWDSLAICEYVAEQVPHKHLWPKDPHLRARARSVVCEMHSGFASLRAQLSMNVLRQIPTPELNSETTAEVKRIQQIWQDCLEASGGPYLFGPYFSIADAMFAPVVTRFRTYSIPLSEPLQKYSEKIYRLPSMQEWIAGAKANA